MKTGLFLAAMVQMAAAQPHQANRHAHLHKKRQVVVTQVVTATAPDAVVWVNADGTPVSTSFASDYAAKKTHVHHTYVATSAPVVAAAAEPTHHRHHHHHHHHDEAPAPVVAAVPATEPAKKPHHKEESHNHIHHQGSSSGTNLPMGITYSPYNADGSCKTQEQVNSDFTKINGYGFVRMYGVDCNQLQTVPSAAKAKGMKMLLGAFNYPPTQDIQAIISAFKGDWTFVDSISVGNEVVASGRAGADDLVGQINASRQALRAANYGGPVVAADMFQSVLDNPQICQASDYAAANAHAFFDSTCDASNAGAWVKSKYELLEKACNKRVVITESGWPHQGFANGAAIPGTSQQGQAIASLQHTFASGNMYLFTAFDDLWKSDFDGSFGAEKYWGFLH